MKLHMLTTVDNPYNPYSEYDAWATFDASAGYNTPQLLARVLHTSHELSDEQEDEAIEEAIDEIVFYNLSGVHTKIEVPSEVSSQADEVA